MTNRSFTYQGAGKESGRDFSLHKTSGYGSVLLSQRGMTTSTTWHRQQYYGFHLVFESEALSCAVWVTMLLISSQDMECNFH